ncbi:MAG TPA: hypothetical protein VIN07_11750, partial [Flavipsychrobacter sp.]
NPFFSVMKKVEIIFASALLLSLIFRVTAHKEVAIMFIISILALLILYTFLGFALFNGIRFRNIFISQSYTAIKPLFLIAGIVHGLTITLLLVSFLFRIQHWVYGTLMMTISSVILALFLIISFFKMQQGSTNPFYKESLTRSGYYLLVVAGNVAFL